MNNLFQTLDGQINSLVLTAINGNVSNVIASASGVLTTALTLYIILMGGLAAWRQINMEQMLRSCVRAAAVALLCTTQYYSPYITQWFTTDIPNWITSAVNGGTSLSVAQQYDLLANSIGKLSAIILTEANPMTQIAERLACWGLLILLGVVAFYSYALFKLALVGVALLVIVGPFLLFLTLFPATRDIPMRWFHSLIGLMIQMAMLIIVTAIAVQLVKTMAVSLANSTGSTDILLVTLAQILGVSVLAVVMQKHVPAMAAGIAGGAGVPTGIASGGVALIGAATMMSARGTSRLAAEIGASVGAAIKRGARRPGAVS